jgi:segregation and condensation protein A
METTITDQFHVKHDTFEGPLEVLLELVERRKLFVNDISLASVTDDFINHIQTKGMHPDQVANFLAVAATLILIKARSLLPNIELTTDESKSITDLERRIALYQVISHISVELIKEYGKKISFEGVARTNGPVFAPDPKLTLDQLPGLVSDMINRIPPAAPAKPEARVTASISITEVLETLHERIQKMLSTNFHDIQVNAPDGDSKSQKVYTIVSFLGMLELVRRGLIAANQKGQFESIELEPYHPIQPSTI